MTRAEYDKQMKAQPIHSMFAWFFVRQDGSQGIAQLPNLPITIALVAWVAMRLVPDASASLSVIVDMSMIVWAWAEIYSGVSGFRKLLGLVALLVIAAGHL